MSLLVHPAPVLRSHATSLMACLNNFRSLNVRGTPYQWISSNTFRHHPVSPLSLLSWIACPNRAYSSPRMTRLIPPDWLSCSFSTSSPSTAFLHTSLPTVDPNSYPTSSVPLARLWTSASISPPDTTRKVTDRQNV